MSIWRLVFQEAWHRRWSLLVQLAGVLVASAAVMAATMILRAHDLRSEQALQAKQQALREQMETMEEEYRKITVRMGFNILILPKDAQLEDFYAQDYASSWMSESAAQTLGASKVITVQHLLPVLQQKVKWPERNRTILLVGASDELAPAGSSSKKPILQPVPPGSALAGHELHRSLGLKVGQSLTLMGRSFKVAACLPERGTRDDITLWIPLADAQELLDKKGLINCIMALECECGMGDVAVVRQELGKLLPDTRIVELAGNALARAEARRQAHRDATELLAREARSREQSRLARQQLATTLATTTVGVCGLWVALAAWANVRSRRGEMGILRALGVSGLGVLALVLGRAVLTGLVGAVLGIVAGAIAGAYGADLPWQNLVLWMVPCAVLAAAPVLSVLAAWIPALVACQIDPAVALREE